MKPDRWQEIERLYNSALECEPEARGTFLRQECGGDEGLRREVESLLGYQGEATGLLEAPIGKVMAEKIAEGESELIGHQIANYRVVSRLGSGGMGEVYLAEDTRLNRKVAIKLLPASLTEDERARKRFVREAKTAAALDHPNICAIHEVGEEEGRSFISMQYVEGETLASRIQQKPFDLKEALDVGAQVAEAITEAHSKGVIHRDIKPQNIMLTARGQVKILDFGLAKVITDRAMLESEAVTQSSLTESGVIVGTVPYMSPEQVKGEPFDARSDIFSFGAVLYEVISGHRPFAAKTAAETISAILMSQPPPLASYSIRAPAGLEPILRKCLEKDRERRYQTMREVASDLENVRRAYESGAFVAPAVDSAMATVRVTSDNRGASLRAFLTSRLGLALAVVVIFLAVASVYTLFFRSTQSVPPSSAKSVNSAAYDYYLRGKVNAGSENRENNESAIKLLEQAVAADPNFAPAYAELARAYNIKTFYLASDVEKKKLNEDAEVDVAKALYLNPELAEGHFARGLILWTHAKRFPHEQAIQSYKHALRLNPNLDEAHHQLAVVYLHIGLLDKAEEEVETALAINPNNTLARYRVAAVKLHQGKYEEALAVYKSIPQEANPALWNRAVSHTLFLLGRTGEAASLVEQYLQTYPQDEGGLITSIKAMLLAKAGKPREAEDAIQHAIEIGKGFGHFHHTAYDVAVAYALLNKPEEAVKWFETAAEDGFPCYPFYENDFNLNSLRKDERFVAFMAKLKQQWERYQATM